MNHPNVRQLLWRESTILVLILAASGASCTGESGAPPGARDRGVLHAFEQELMKVNWPGYAEDGFGPDEPDKEESEELRSLLAVMAKKWGWVEPETTFADKESWWPDGQRRPKPEDAYWAKWARRILEQRTWSEAYRASMRWYHRLYGASAVRFVRLEVWSHPNWDLVFWAVDLGGRTVVLTSLPRPDQFAYETRYSIGMAESEAMAAFFGIWNRAVSEGSASDIQPEGYRKETMWIDWHILTVYEKGKYRHRIWAVPNYQEDTHGPESPEAKVRGQFDHRNPCLAAALAYTESETGLLMNKRILWKWGTDSSQSEQK